jgi:hypothetical protein
MMLAGPRAAYAHRQMRQPDQTVSSQKSSKAAQEMATFYTAFVGVSIMMLKEFNSVVPEPYMVPIFPANAPVLD